MRMVLRSSGLKGRGLSQKVPEWRGNWRLNLGPDGAVDVRLRAGRNPGLFHPVIPLPKQSQADPSLGTEESTGSRSFSLQPSIIWSSQIHPPQPVSYHPASQPSFYSLFSALCIRLNVVT